MGRDCMHSLRYTELSAIEDFVFLQRNTQCWFLFSFNQKQDFFHTFQPVFYFS